MATPYELACLAGLSYEKPLQERQSTHYLDKHDLESKPVSDEEQEEALSCIEEKRFDPSFSSWVVYNDCGLGGGMFCTKFIREATNEEVIAFRGTRGLSSSQDWMNNIIHLFTRNSPYIDKAKEFIRANRSPETIITGHSLGGFLAITMAFYYESKVVAFNPPWVSGAFSILTKLANLGTSKDLLILINPSLGHVLLILDLMSKSNITLFKNLQKNSRVKIAKARVGNGVLIFAALADEAVKAMDVMDAKTSHSFSNSKIKVYFSSLDLATKFTEDGMLDFPNVERISIGPVGFHFLDPMVKHFKANHHNGQNEIRW